MNIRKVTEADAKELLAIYTPYVEETAITFEYEVPSEDEFLGRIRKISARFPYLVAEEDGEILGYAYAGTFKDRAAYDWSVESTIYLKMDCRRKGIGRALYGALEDSLREIGILNVNACIAVPKIEDRYLTMDSIYFHEKMGYAPVGTFHDSGYKFQTWYDMIWMEKMLGDHTEIAEPVRFGEWECRA